MMKIMAPAGNRDSFDAALQAGADEVYMGLSGFGARHFAGNFTPNEFCQAIDDAHSLETKVNLTLNTITSDAELEVLYPQILRLYETGLDAVIVQDWGVVAWIRENFPQLPIHASTQMSIANAKEAKIIESAQLSINRLVLARELSFNELQSVRNQTKLELEVFVSGALCLACSGKCYLSSFLGGRSGNRGTCAQPCRHRYRLLSSIENKNIETFSDFSFLKTNGSSNNNYCPYFSEQSNRQESIFDSVISDNQEYIGNNSQQNGFARKNSAQKVPESKKSPLQKTKKQSTDIPEPNDEYKKRSEGYFLSLKDQWQTFTELKRLHQIGVDVLKIEGRMKSPFYVFQAVQYFRNQLNLLAQDEGVTEFNSRFIYSFSPNSENSCLKNKKEKQNLPQDNSLFYSNSSQFSSFSDSLILNHEYKSVNNTLLSQNNSSDIDFTFSNEKKPFSLTSLSPLEFELYFQFKEEKNRTDSVSSIRSIRRLFNRGYGRGYFYEHDPKIINSAFSAAHGVEIGKIQNGEIILSDSLCLGDGIVFLDKDLQKITGQNVSKIFVLNKKNPSFSTSKNKTPPQKNFQSKQKTEIKSDKKLLGYQTEESQVSKAEAGDKIRIGLPTPVNAVWIYKTFDIALQRFLEHIHRQIRRQIPIDLFLEGKTGQPLRLTLRHKTAQVVCSSDVPLESSKKHSILPDELKKQLNRFGQSNFYLRKIETDISSDVFIPLSLLNKLRQQATEQLTLQIPQTFHRQPSKCTTQNCNTSLDFPPTPDFLSQNDQQTASLINTNPQQTIDHSQDLNPLQIINRPKYIDDPQDLNPSNSKECHNSENQFDFEYTLNTKNDFISFNQPSIDLLSLRKNKKTDNKQTNTISYRNITFSATVQTLQQQNICRHFGINRFYLPGFAVCFQDELDEKISQLETFLQNGKEQDFYPLASSLTESAFFESKHELFALNWTFNITNSWSIKQIRQLFPTADTLFFSPELSADTVQKLTVFAKRCSLKSGLTVYGRLPAMQTRKTLFPQQQVQLLNQTKDPISVVRQMNTFGMLRRNCPGSLVYFDRALDLTPCLFEILNAGIQELRFDWTNETPAEIQTILSSVLSGIGVQNFQAFSNQTFASDTVFKINRPLVSYGWKTGIF